MEEQRIMRLSLAAKKLNVGIVTVVEKLAARGYRIENNPNAKLNYEHLQILAKEYNNNSLFEDGGTLKPVLEVKPELMGSNSDILYFRSDATITESDISKTIIPQENKLSGLTILGKIDLDKKDNSSKKVLQSKQEEILVKLNIEKDKSYRVALEKIQKYKKTGQGDTLNLSDLDLYSIPKELIQLTKLKKIQLNNNSISEIENLPLNINEVELNNNLILRVNNIPSKVTILRINHNRLSTIDKLPNSIQVLEADDNQILKTLQLPLSLKKIKLNNNQIKEIEFPPHVESIAVCNNQIDNLIPIESYKRLSELYLYGNQIKGIRPEIFGEQENYNCLKGLKNYLIELERKTEINRNVKLLLVGNSGVGKSSILRALKGLPFDEKIKSTHAVSLDNLEFGDKENSVKFQVWDLGGQEIYYGTHRVFMMSPSIQLVIFDSETESISKSPDRLKTDEKVRNINLPFYISRIEELSPDSKIIIVQNKFETMSAFPQRLKYLFDKYQVSKVRALDNKNIRILEAQILEEAMNLNIYGIEVPYYWERVREYCENILKRPTSLVERTITKERFREICISEKVLLEGIDDLLRYLHDTGVVYYKEDLGNTIVIDQMWALRAIYKVFDRESKFYEEMREHSNGKCTVRTLFQDFDDLEETYSIDEKWIFLMYMKSCGMCFPIKPNPKERDNLDTFYVFPEFLPTQKTDIVRLWELKGTKKQIWRKKFDFLPFYPLHIFISKYGCKTQHNFVWRNGILIYLNEQNFDGFLIEANFEDNYLQITIDDGIVDWLEVIKESIVVHGDNNKNLWALIEGETVEVDVIRTERDLDNLADVEQKITIGGLNSQRKGKLVLSYAKEDLDEVKLLAEYLDAQKIDYWYDERLSSREAWDKEINREFMDASGYLIILSANYMHPRKRFIHEEEIPIILEGYKKNKFATILNVKAFDLQNSSEISKINRYLKGKVLPNIESDYYTACDFINTFISEEILTKFL